MKRPKLKEFKREVYDGQHLADWYKEYYQALEKYIDELEQVLHIHDVVGRSEQLVCPDCVNGRDEFEPNWNCPECRRNIEAI